MKKLRYSFLLLSVLCGTALWAQLSVASLFSDHAVLQQGKEIPVWGWGTPGERVEVALGESRVSTVVQPDGSWRVNLPAMPADGKGYEMVVKSARQELHFRDVCVGEVWLASGQSNMEWTLRSGVLNKDQEVATADYPLIRHFKVPAATAAQPQPRISGAAQWVVASPDTVADFSAVGYFFARQLHLDKGVPVGIINASRGATDIETWMSKEALNAVPFMEERMARVENDPARWNAYVDSVHAAEQQREVVAANSEVGLKKKVHTVEYEDSWWTKALYPIDMPKMGASGFWGVIWLRKSFDLPAQKRGKSAELLLPLLNRDDRVYLNGKELGRSVYRTGKVTVPAGLLRSGKNVLAVRMYVHWGDAAIGRKGEVCELRFADGQACSLQDEWRGNRDTEPKVAQWNNYYCRPMVSYNAMVAPLIPYAIRGFLWYQGENNAGKGNEYMVLQPRLTDDWRIKWQEGYLPFLYVQLAGYQPHSEEPRAADSWASFRDAQYRCQSLSHASAMASAVDLGEAENIHPANKQGVADRLYRLAKSVAYGESGWVQGPQFHSCELRDDKLLLSFLAAPGGLRMREGSKSFAVFDAAGKGHWVKATLDGRQVVLDCSGITTPMRVQYAWQSNPEVTLYDSNDCPAVPFFTNIFEK